MQSNEAVILSRVSSKDQEETGYSLPAQEKYLREYCERKSLMPKKVFRIAESASGKKQREEFDAMIAFIDKHDIKHFVVEKVDRLTRNFKDAVMIDDWLEEDEERKLHLVKDTLIMHKNSRSQEKLNWGVRIIFAKNYIDNLKEEVEKGMKEKLAQGWLPGSPPAGYQTIGEKGHKIHIPNEETAPLARKLFELYDSGEHSIKSLTAVAEQLGLRTRYGRPYTKSAIHTMLRNPFYIGKNLWEGQVYDGKQEPIISKQLFDRVQAKLTSQTTPKYNKHNPLFKAMIRCVKCEGVITWQLQKGHWYGRCNGYRGCVNKYFVRQEVLEEQLMAAFEPLISPSPAIIAWAKDAIRERHANDMDAHNAHIRRLRTRYDDLQRRMDIMYDDRVDGRLTTERYDAKVAEAETERKQIKETLAEIDTNYTASLEYGLNILELSQHAAEIYQQKDDPERRGILRDLFLNLSLEGRSLGYSYTKLAAAIADKVEKEKAVIEKFEQQENPSTKGKEAVLAASRSIWLRRQDSNL